jgi:ATP-dependent protease HslVU (ClpYQ) peptidase subunit
MITKEEDDANTYALLRMQRDGYKNSCDALAARVAELEAGGDGARVKELSAELERLNAIIDAQQDELTRQALDLAHGGRWAEDVDFYRTRANKLQEERNAILEILGHGDCDGLDHTYDWDH